MPPASLAGSSQRTIARSLRALREAATQLPSVLDVRSAAASACETLVRELGAAVAELWLYGEPGQRLALVARAELDEPGANLPPNARVPPAWVEQVARGGEALVSHDVQGDIRFAALPFGSAGLEALASFPLVVGDQPRGVLVYGARRPLGPERVELLGTFAGVVAASLHAIQVRLRQQEAQEAAQRNEAVLRATTAYSIIGTDQSGAIAVFNEGAERMLGYRAAEVIGRSVELIHDPDEVRLRAAERGLLPGFEVLVAAARRGEAETGEWAYVRKDGSTLVVSLTVTAMRDARGALSGFIGIAHDITERKHAQEALQRLSHQHELILSSAAEGIYGLDLDGATTFANPAGARMLGYEAEELIGTGHHELLHYARPDGTPYPTDECPIAAALQDGAVHRVAGEVFWRRDGASFPVEYVSTPIRDKGRVLGAVVVFHDITDRKRAEVEQARLLRQAEQAEAKFRGLLESAPDAILTVDQAGTIVLVNSQAERIFGYQREEVLGQPVEMLVPERHRAVQPAHREHYLRAPSPRPMDPGLELRGRRKDGTEFPAEVSLSALTTDQGVLVTSVIRDITERKQAEEQLRRAAEALAQQTLELARSNADLEQFAYVASHDLQEPLRMVASYTQLLQRRYQGRLDADADEFITFAVDGAQRMQRLIGDLLAYSLVGTRGQQLAPTDTAAVVDRVVVDLGAVIAESGAAVTRGDLPTVLADAPQLGQLFQNLLINAIKFRGAEPPRVHVSAARHGGAWLFTVQDNGIGIAPEYAERIFVIFQRLHHRTKYPGTGIGLAICKKIVERHGGRIWIESTPGQGASFHFTIPAVKEGES